MKAIFNRKFARIFIFVISISVVVLALGGLFSYAASEATLAERVSQMDNGVIVLTQPETVSGTVTVSVGEDIIIDLNGNTVTLDGDTAFFAIDKGVLTVKNGTVVTAKDSSIFSLGGSSELNLINIQVNSGSANLFYIDGEDNVITLSSAVLTYGSFIDNHGEVTVKDASGNVVDTDGLTSPSFFHGPFDVNVGSGEDGDQLESDVNATVTGSYSVSVPANIDFGNISYADASDDANKYATVTADIEVTHLVVGASKLVVSVKGAGENGKFEIVAKDDSGYTLAYEVLDKNGKIVEVDGVVAEFSSVDKQTITLRLDRSTLQYVGDYTGKIYFDVTLE